MSMNRRQVRTVAGVAALVCAIALLAVGMSRQIVVYYAKPAGTASSAPAAQDDAGDPFADLEPAGHGAPTADSAPGSADTQAADDGSAAETRQSITGSNESPWTIDKSREKKVGPFEMIGYAATGGVARAGSDLHLTGKNACPT